MAKIIIRQDTRTHVVDDTLVGFRVDRIKAGEFCPSQDVLIIEAQSCGEALVTIELSTDDKWKLLSLLLK